MEPEENKEGLAPTPTSEETPEEKPETPVEEPKETPQDIDFKKELEALEGEKPPTKNELDKAKRALHFNAERVRELGGDPTEIIEPKKPDEQKDYVTKLDLARLEARQFARSEDELKLIMWWVENKGLSVEDAHLMANKNKIKSTFEELKRVEKPPIGSDGTAGRKMQTSTVPPMPRDQQEILRRRGFSFNPKTNTYDARFNRYRYDETSKQWVSEKKV
mgnify:CR=1 FL=1